MVTNQQPKSNNNARPSRQSQETGPMKATGFVKGNQVCESQETVNEVEAAAVGGEDADKLYTGA